MRRKPKAGFTLVELLVTMAILAILLTIGLPSFRDSLRSNRLATSSNELIAAISMARSEAVRTTRGGGICGSNAAGTSCVSSNTWTNGLLVWTDGDPSSATPGFRPATDTIVRRVEAKPGIALSIDPAGTSPENYQIQFNGLGRVAGPSGSPRAVTLTPDPCPSGRDLLRKLKMTSVGQVNLMKENCP